MKLRIEGHDLPGRICVAGAGFPGYVGVHVGVQRKDKPAELLDLQPGDAASVGWTLDCRVTEGARRGGGKRRTAGDRAHDRPEGSPDLCPADAARRGVERAGLSAAGLATPGGT
jgi:hypothetical protein